MVAPTMKQSCKTCKYLALPLAKPGYRTSHAKHLYDCLYPTIDMAAKSAPSSLKSITIETRKMSTSNGSECVTWEKYIPENT